MLRIAGLALGVTFLAACEALKKSPAPDAGIPRDGAIPDVYQPDSNQGCQRQCIDQRTLQSCPPPFAEQTGLQTDIDSYIAVCPENTTCINGVCQTLPGRVDPECEGKGFSKPSSCWVSSVLDVVKQFEAYRDGRDGFWTPSVCNDALWRNACGAERAVRYPSGYERDQCTYFQQWAPDCEEQTGSPFYRAFDAMMAWTTDPPFRGVSFFLGYNVERADFIPDGTTPQCSYVRLKNLTDSFSTCGRYDGDGFYFTTQISAVVRPVQGQLSYTPVDQIGMLKSRLWTCRCNTEEGPE